VLNKPTRFLCICILFALSIGGVEGKTKAEIVSLSGDLLPFLQGLLLMGVAYASLIYYISNRSVFGYTGFILGLLSTLLRTYAHPHVFAILLHLIVLSALVYGSYVLSKFIRILQITKERNEELEQKVAQRTEELAHKQASLNAVVESTPDLIYSLDSHYNFVTMNTATKETFQKFYKKEVVLGSNYKKVVDKAVFDMMARYLAKAFKGELITAKLNYEMDKVMYHREVYLNPIYENGTITGISVFSKDITQTETTTLNLSYSESLLEATFEQSPDALFLVDYETCTIKRCNLRAIQMYETTDETQLLEKNIFEFHKQHTAYEEYTRIMQIVQEKGVWTGEYEYTTFKKSTFWAVLKISNLLLGNTKYLLARVSDISERKENENKVAEKEANLRAILESNDQSIWLIDQTHMLIDHNQVFVEMLKKTFGLTLAAHMDMVASLPYIYQTMWKLRYKRVLKGYREVYIDAYEYDGNEYVYQITGFPIYEKEQDKVTSASFFARNITAQVTAERELTASQRLLDSINQHLQDALFRSTPNGKVLYANLGFVKMFGYTEEELYTKDIHDFYENATTRTKLQELLIANQRYDNQECKMKRKDGSLFWVSISTTQNYDENGNVYYDGIIRNITEARHAKSQLKKQNIKLKKVNSELDKFVYSASHDLRAPLSSLLGLLDIIRLTNSEEERQMLYEMMLKSVKKLDDFIYQIIQYSRNSRVEVKVQAIDFQAVLASIFDDLKYMANGTKVKRHIAITIDTPFFSDEFRLNVILNNLISNAFRYTNPNTEQPFVKVLIHVSTEKAHIEISDNGIGIKAEHVANIFKMFYRASDSNTGSGIGLYILKEALDVLKGKIHVDSVEEQGTTFTLEIPNLGNRKNTQVANI